MGTAVGIAVRGMLIAGSIASSAHAVDGVREINQTCASGPGCFAGDTAGFPVQVTTRGSYRLTSNLTPPNQNTTLMSITASGVTVDLNGFAIQGTNAIPGPGGPCSASGSGIGVNTSASDVVVSNGYVVGMGSHGLRLLGANSRVERVTVEMSCGNGIQVGFGSLVSESIARQNSGTGIFADLTSRVSGSVAVLNGATGIASSSNLGLLTVDGCIADNNGIDGIFVGERSLVRGNHTHSNQDDGIAALGSGQVVENVAAFNSDRGITVLGAPGSGDSTAVGLNVTSDNGGLNLSGGVVVGCNVVNDVPSCPP
jgi:parallel beta helix pectate lyase-like protein